MAVSSFESCETGSDADACRRLVDTEAKARNLDCRLAERKTVRNGELGRRHC